MMAPGTTSKFCAPIFEIGVFSKQLHCIEENTCEIVETFRRPHSDSAPCELCPPMPPIVTPLFVCFFHYPRSHFTQLLIRALFFGPCHYSCIFVPCLAFRVHVAGDLNQTISFVASIVTTSFASALLRFFH